MSRTERLGCVRRLRLTYFDPDELLGVVNGGQIQHTLTGGPNFHAELAHVRLDDFALDRGAYSVPVLASGSFKPDAICIGTATAAERPTVVNGVSVMPKTLQIYCEGCELEYVAGPDAVWCALTVTRDELQRCARALIGTELAIDDRGLMDLRPDASALAAVERAVDGMLSTTRSGRDESKRIARRRERLVEAYVRAIASADGRLNDVTHANPSRRRVAERVREWLATNLSEPYSSRAVCEIAGCSERYVEIAFRERYQLSPRRWHLVQRLNQVRRDLLDGKAAADGITGVATLAGFYELGRFSVKYRQLFGERPSETAARHKRNDAGVRRG